MPATQILLAFNSGELSPYFRHRSDVDKLSSGAELMQNFVAMPFGAVRKRPGTRHLQTLSAATRLEAFQFNAETSYLMAFTASHLKIFRSDGTLAATLTPTVGSGDPPAFGDPFLLQFAQINDVIFITSHDAIPRRLSRNGDTSWTLEEIPWTYPPMLDTNRDENWKYDLHPTNPIGAWADGQPYAVGALTMNDNRIWECVVAHASSNAPSTISNEPGKGAKYNSYWKEYYIRKGWSGIMETALTNPPFQFGQIGSYFEVSRRRAFNQFEVDMKLQSPTIVPGFSPAILIKGKWSFATVGIWHGTVYLQRSEDNGVTWADFQSFSSTNDENFSSEGLEEKRVMLRMRFYFDPNVASERTVLPRATITAEEPYITSLVKITGFVPGTAHAVTFQAMEDLDPVVTEIWREGAFSRHQGYPAAISVHERRLIFAGTRRRAVSIWTSKTDDLMNFTPGSTEADAPIMITLAATRQDPIRWIAAQRRLIIGTAGSEWVFGSDTSDAPLSPDNLLVRPYTYFGSAAMPALTMHNGVFYIERHSRRLREMAYQLDRETYDAADLTRLAEHITDSGLVQTAWQGNREPALWAVRADGVLVHFSYIRAEKVAAWSRHVTQGGKFRSVAVARSETGDDAVFAVVERGGQFHLEYFVPSQQATQEEGALVDCYHVDAGVTGTPDSNRQLAVPAHLNGQKLAVLADGYHLELVAGGGKITLPHAYTKVSAGLPVVSRLVTMPIDIQSDQGLTHAKLKRANAVKLSLYQSFGGSVVYRDQVSDITTTTPDTPGDAPPPLATGWYEVTLGGGYEQDLQFEIHHASPHPFTVRAAALDWAVSEGR